MARKRCPIERIHDKKTGLIACDEWCPVADQICPFEGAVVVSYKATHGFLDIREKLLKHNKKESNRLYKERMRKVV